MRFGWRHQQPKGRSSSAERACRRNGESATGRPRSGRGPATVSGLPQPSPRSPRVERLWRAGSTTIPPSRPERFGASRHSTALEREAPFDCVRARAGCAPVGAGLARPSRVDGSGRHPSGRERLLPDARRQVREPRAPLLGADPRRRPWPATNGSRHRETIAQVTANGKADDGGDRSHQRRVPGVTAARMAIHCRRSRSGSLS